MKIKNQKKIQFLASFPTTSFNSDSCDHALRSKFNFSYFDSSQIAGQDFSAWTQGQLDKLLRKLVEYGKSPLSYWKNQRVGGGGRKVLEVYGGFPRRSNFVHPKHIPVDVQWARFRLEGDMRLIGFIIPSDLNGVPSRVDSKMLFCANTFYVVFLDANHQFYLSGE